MRKSQIRSITRKKYRSYPSKEKVIQLGNLLKGDFSTQTINKKRVTDITCIYTLKDRWCYLTSVLDLYSKKVAEHSFSRSMTTELVIKAVKNAYDAQKPAKGFLLHSDLGSKYTSHEFMNFVHSFGIVQSFSQKAIPMIIPVLNLFVPL